MGGKKRSARVHTVGLAAPALLFGLTAAAPPGAVGIAAVIVKEVTLHQPGAHHAHPAKAREQVFLAEQVATGAASRLQILLLDQSSFTVGANARLTLDRFIYDPDRKSNFAASVAKGAFRFMSGRNGHAATSTIKSPVASIGIRGTMVDGIVGQHAVDIVRRERGVGNFANPDPETATLVVLRGPGPKTTGRVNPGAMVVEAGGTSVEIDRPAFAVFVPRPGSQPIGPFQMSLPGLAELGSYLLPPIDARLPGSDQPTYVPPASYRHRPYKPGPGFEPYQGPPSPRPAIPSLSLPPRPAPATPPQPSATGQVSTKGPPSRTSNNNPGP